MPRLKLRGMQLGIPTLRGVSAFPAPTGLSPEGFVDDTKPELSWNSVIGATNYTVRVLDADANVVYENLTAISPVTSDALDTLDGPFTLQVSANPNGAVAESTFNVINYVINDEFTTNEAAPVATPRTAEPGPGTLDVVSTASAEWQIAGGILDVDASSTLGTPYITNAGYARATGLAIGIRLAQNPNGPGPNETISPVMGWVISAATSGAANTSGAFFWTASNQWGFADQNVSEVRSVSIPTANTFYDFCFVLRSTGAFTIIGDKLEFVHKIGNQATMYPQAAQFSANRHTPRLDKMRVAQLGQMWADDYGIVTTRLAGARSVSDTFIHQAGGQIIEFILTTLPASGSIDVRFRIQDASNYWALRVSSTGALTLVEVVAGTPTTRTTLASNLAGDRLICQIDGTRARLSRQRSGAGTSAAVYAGVSTFTTQTDGLVASLGTGGAISDLEAWPRTLTGDALEWLTTFLA